jgi:hypothetical protein
VKKTAKSAPRAKPIKTPAGAIAAATHKLEDSILTSCRAFERATGMFVVAITWPGQDTDFGRRPSSDPSRVRVITSMVEPKP